MSSTTCFTKGHSTRIAPPCGSYYRITERFGLKILFSGLLFVLLFGLFAVPVAAEDDLSPKLRVLTVDDVYLVSIDGGSGSVDSPLIFAIDIPAHANIMTDSWGYAENVSLDILYATSAVGEKPYTVILIEETVGNTFYVETNGISGHVFPAGEYQVRLQYLNSDGNVCYSNTVSFSLVEPGTTIALSGFGTEESPYLIQSSADLKLLSDEVKSGKTFADTYFAITNDIDLSSYTDWQPIGDFLVNAEVKDYASPYLGLAYIFIPSMFQGKIDGKEHTISHLTIEGALSAQNFDFNGLFGVVGPGAVIQNIKLTDVSVSSNAGWYTGGLIGGIYCYFGLGSDSVIIENCHVEGEINGNGGLIGRAYSDLAPIHISGCSVDISGVVDGGLIGEIFAPDISVLSSSSKTSQTSKINSGLINMIIGKGSILISDCYSTGYAVSAGLIDSICSQGGGLLSVPITIKNSYSTVTVEDGSGLIDSAYTSESNVLISIKNSVALNPSVSGEYSSARTIDYTSYNEGDSLITTSGIYALSTMISDATDGIDLSPTDAVTQTFYEDTLGWDFDTIWKMDSSVSPYPILQQTSTPEPVEEYTITFDSNGGTGSMGSATVSAGDSYSLPTCTFTAPEGQVFKAWDIDGTEYAAGASYTPTASVTVKAVWTLEDTTAPGIFTINPLENGIVSWTVSEGATGYKFSLRDRTISETEDTGKKVNNEDVGTATNYDISSYLVEGHSYRVAVCAYNDAGKETWVELEFVFGNCQHTTQVDVAITYEGITSDFPQEVFSDGTHYWYVNVVCDDCKVVLKENVMRMAHHNTDTLSKNGVCECNYYTIVPDDPMIMCALEDVSTYLIPDEDSLYCGGSISKDEKVTVLSEGLGADGSWSLIKYSVTGTSREKVRFVKSESLGETSTGSTLCREVIILVDTSEETAEFETDIENDVFTLWHKLTQSEIPTKVAIISYSLDVTIHTGFISDTKELDEAAAELTWNGRKSNLYLGLQGADMLFEKAGSENAEQSLVILSAGIPTAGPSSDDNKYFSGYPFHSSKKYGEAIYNLYDTSLRERFKTYDVYGIQYLPDGSSSDKSFSDHLFNLLTTKGIYSKDDIFNIGLIPGDKNLQFSSNKNNLQKLTYTVHYSDDLFSKDSTTYNHELAQVSLGLSATAFSNANVDYLSETDDDSYDYKTTRYSYLEDAYRKLGFDSLGYYGYHTPLDYSENIAYGIASKEIEINGNHKTVLSIVVRGGGYGSEWAENFILDDGSGADAKYVEGFSKYSDLIYRSFIQYYQDMHSTSGDTIVWITGYGRGGAVSNLLAGKIDNNLESLGLSKENVYVYTFAAPNCVDTSYGINKDVHTGYENIYNIVNPSDLAPSLPSVLWNYDKYGKNLYFNYNNADTQMLSSISDDYSSLTGGGLYLPTDYTKSVAFLNLRLSETFGDKDEYISTHQYYFHDLFKLMNYKSEMDILSLNEENYHGNQIKFYDVFGHKGVEAFAHAQSIENRDELVNDLRFNIGSTIDRIKNDNQALNDIILTIITIISNCDPEDSGAAGWVNTIRIAGDIMDNFIFVWDSLSTYKETVKFHGDGEYAKSAFTSEYMLYSLSLDCATETGAVNELYFEKYSTVYSTITTIVKGDFKDMLLRGGQLFIQLISNIFEESKVNSLLNIFVIIGNMHGFTVGESVNEIYKFMSILDNVVSLSSSGDYVGTVVKQHDVEIYMTWMQADFEESELLTTNHIAYEKLLSGSAHIVNAVSEGEGGFAFGSTVLDTGKCTTLYAKPADESINFIGWFDESGKMVSNKLEYTTDPIKETVTYYARFSGDVYSIRYYLDGGVNHPENPTEYSPTNEDIIIKPPTKEDYEFRGWNIKGSSEIVSQPIIPLGSYGDIEYTALWVAKRYIFNYQVTLDNDMIERIELPGIKDGETITIMDSVVSYSPESPKCFNTLWEFEITLGSPFVTDEDCTIFFSIEPEELPSSVEPDDIFMYHLVDGTWVKLDTTYLCQLDTGTHMYKATTSSFSPFAIGYDITTPPLPDTDSMLGNSKNTGSGNYAEYPRTVTNGGYVDFGTSPVVKGVTLPEGVSGKVVLIAKSKTPAPEGKEAYGVFEINVASYPTGEKSVISFTIPLSDLQKKGFTEKDICLYHFDGEVWTKLPTTYTVEGDKVFYEAETTAFSPFAIVYEKEGATSATVSETPVEPEKPSDEPVSIVPEVPSSSEPQETESPAPVLGMTLGALGAAVLMRRK